MKKLTQNGFGVAGFVMVLVVIIGLTATGWFVYDKQQDKKAQDAALASQESDGTSGGAMDGYLAIPELGIELKLGNGVTDANYGLLSDGATFGISTDSLVSQLGEGCAAVTGNVAQIAVFVESEGPNFGTGAEGVSVYPDAFKSADGTYYALNYDAIKNGMCGDSANNPEAAQDLSNRVIDGFSKTKVDKIQY